MVAKTKEAQGAVQVLGDMHAEVLRQLKPLQAQSEALLEAMAALNGDPKETTVSQPGKPATAATAAPAAPTPDDERSTIRKADGSLIDVDTGEELEPPTKTGEPAVEQEEEAPASKVVEKPAAAAAPKKGRPSKDDYMAEIRKLGKELTTDFDAQQEAGDIVRKHVPDGDWKGATLAKVKLIRDDMRAELEARKNPVSEEAESPSTDIDFS